VAFKVVDKRGGGNGRLKIKEEEKRMEVAAKNKKKGGRGDVWRIGEKSGADAFIVRACE
jgi:hypothetical protein